MPPPFSPEDERIGAAVAADLARGPLINAQYADPGRAARVNEVARRLGIAPEIVDADYHNMTATDRLRRGVMRAETNPVYARMMANPRVAAAGIDDDSLYQLAGAVRQMLSMMLPGTRLRSTTALTRQPERVGFARGLWRSIGAFPSPLALIAGRLGESGTQDIQQRGFMATTRSLGSDISPRNIGTSLVAGGASLMEQIHGVEEMLSPLAGPLAPVFAERHRQSGDYWRDVVRRWRPETETRFGRDVLSGVESAPASVIAYGGGAITGSAKLAAGALGLLTAGGSYRTGRDAGLSPLQATFYGLIDGTIEAGTELIPLKGFLSDVASGHGLGRTLLHNVLAEGGTEQIATLGQDFNRWAQIDAPAGKPFSEFAREIPDHALSTFIASTVVASTQTSAAYGLGRLADRSLQRDETLASSRTVDRIMEAAAGSSFRTANPGDFQEMLSGQMIGLPGEYLYFPAAAVRTLHQSPEDLAEDAFWGAYADQIHEAEALEGDVVVPLAAAATHLAGTPQWEALKDQVRASPGGFSRAEMKDFDEAHADERARMGEEMEAILATERAAMEPQAKVYEAMRDKLRIAGFTADAASQLATQFAQRQRTRAERLGQKLTGEEAGNIEVRQVLPENLSRTIRAAEVPDAGLREVIAEMKRGRGERSERARLGPSLLDWIVSQGGIEDKGGDIAAMGAIQMKKGRAKKGQRRLIRPHEDTGMLVEVGKQNTNTPDELALRAWEAGYFPEFTERPDVNTLLDAIAEGLAGRHRYVPSEVSESDQLRAAAQELYEILDQQGIDPDKATPQEIAKALSQYQSARMQGRALDQSLFEDPDQPERTMTAAQRAELEARQMQGKSRRGGQQGLGDQKGGLFSSERDQGLLFQSDMSGPRGRITFGEGGKYYIDLFESRDLSTFIHESGHLYLEEMKADAELALGMDTDEARRLFADWEAVKAWFKREGHPIGEDGVIPTEAHELWARGFERFAMEGRAPSSALKRAFEAFRSWLLTIYQVVENLRAPITPEIRDVMGRLLATDEEIAAVAEEQNIKALFNSAEEAGMTEAEFRAYREATEEARGGAYDALLYRTMASIRAQRTQEHKEREGRVRADVTAEVDALPVFRALRLLRTGKLEAEDEARNLKLDKAWIVETYGADALDALPRSVPPLYADKSTVHPDQIAEELGLSSGDELVRILMGHERARQDLRARGDKRSPRQVAIDEGTAARMAERYGDPLRDGSIEEEARALIHNDRQGEVIASEIRALARRANKRPTPYSIARQWAADKIAAGEVRDVASGAALQQYQRAARKAGQAAEAAMLKGDVDETYRQKQAQMLNNALISEGKKAKDRVDVAVRRLGRIARRRQMQSVAQDYLDQAHALLEQVDLKQRSQADVERQKAFETWHAEQTAAGHDVIVPESFAARLGTTHWSRLSVEKLIGLDDTVQQIMHLGRLKQTLLDGQERRAFDEIVAEAEAAAAKLPPRPPSDVMEPGFGERLRHSVAAFDAALLKVETLVDWLDGKDPNGIFNRIVFKPIAEAQGKAADMFAATMARLNEALAKVPARRLARWGDRITAPELLNPETGNPFVLTRQQLVSMALNMGNAGNAQRLADGYRWNEARIMDVLNRELTAEEWAYVQEVWDTIGELWPHIEALETRVNGLPPEKVPARPLETSAGTLAGGYFPVVYDTRRDYSAERNAARESDLFETRYTRATTRAGATKERAEEVKRPILLNLGVITRHVGEVIHDITHREAVMNADKFLSSRRIMKAIDETLGREARAQLRPWLKFVANQWAMERAGNEGVGAFINKLRSNATVVGLGFRFSTVMMQVAGYSNSFEAVGTKWVSQAVAQTSAHPIETFRFVMERSAEIRHRMDTLDRDIDAGIRRMAGKRGYLTAAKRFAFHGIGYMDRLVVIPTWMGAYNKALASGLDEQEAIYAADKAVRQSQGAGAAKDMAAVQRGTGQWGQALKLMTMFYSYLSAVYQRQRNLGRDVRNLRSPKDLPGIVARAWWLIVVPPLMSELLGGRGPDDDEEWGWWALKNMMFQGIGAIPVARDLGRPVWDAVTGGRPFDYQLSPLQRAGQSLVSVAKDVGKVTHGKETRHATRDVLEAAGYWTGLVPGQFAQATQFLVDVGAGDADPETANDWFRGLTTGRMPED